MNAIAEASKTKPNKPNQTQYKANTKPIPEKPKMKLNSYSTKDYENDNAFRPHGNKAKQTQLVAASCPA